jgi:hypothetical protein
MKRSSEEKSENWRGLKFRNFWKVDNSDPGSAIIPTNRWGVCVCAPEHRIEYYFIIPVEMFIVIFGLKIVLILHDCSASFAITSVLVNKYNSFFAIT